MPLNNENVIGTNFKKFSISTNIAIVCTSILLEFSRIYVSVLSSELYYFSGKFPIKFSEIHKRLWWLSFS